METMANAEILQSLREMFPLYMPKMEAATTSEEFYTVHDELISELRQNLRNALASADIPESAFTSLLESNREGTAMEAHEIDSVELNNIINARENKVKEIVESMFNGLKAVGDSPKDISTARMAARLIVNRLIAAGSKGIQGANNKLKQYNKLNPAEMAELSASLQEALEAMTEDERTIVGSAFAGATAAAVAGITFSAGAAIIIAVVLIIVAVLIPFLVFMLMEAACVILVVNDVRKNGGDYDKYILDNNTSYNVHGKETSYVPKIVSAITVIDEFDVTHVFSSGGFFTTEKRSGALYGTNYGFSYKIANTNHTVSFGVESPLIGKNKCYCGFDVSAETAAKNVKDNLTCEASISGFKAHIAMNSTSGKTAYYIARITDTF